RPPGTSRPPEPARSLAGRGRRRRGARRTRRARGRTARAGHEGASGLHRERVDRRESFHEPCRRIQCPDAALSPAASPFMRRKSSLRATVRRLKRAGRRLARSGRRAIRTLRKAPPRVRVVVLVVVLLACWAVANAMVQTVRKP